MPWRDDGTGPPPDPLADLAWLLLSPPLLNPEYSFGAEVQGFTPAQREQIQQWLGTLDPVWVRREVAHCLQGPAHAQRLGRYAEALLAFFLSHGPTHEARALNLSVRQDPAQAARTDHTTRGEIDALLVDRQGQPWHWELAVKFFLCVACGPQAEPDDFVGPDHAETLAGKLHKLFQRQLPLQPPPPWDAQPWRPAAMARGWMFYRRGQPVPACAALAADHLRGTWLPVDACGELPRGRYAVLPRMQWMRPLRGLDEAMTLPWQALPEHVRQAGAPTPRRTRAAAVLVARLQAGPQGWDEQDRCFIVPEGWEPRTRAQPHGPFAEPSMMR